jgi:hypothetical protein
MAVYIPLVEDCELEVRNRNGECMFHAEKKRAVHSTGALLLALAMLFFISIEVHAQVTGGELIGVVTDPTAAAVPSASVVVKNAASGITRSTIRTPSALMLCPTCRQGITESRSQRLASPMFRVALFSPSAHNRC